jgi:hypothetical protein
MLADAVAALGYHPVVVFGNSNSGKTTMLLSLFALLMTNEMRIGIRLGEPLIDIGQPTGLESWERAQRLFGEATQRFIQGQAPNATATREPFFVPLIITPPPPLPEVKIALMESNGEWYRPDWDTPALLPSFRKQIEDFIVHFPRAITFIHAVPRTQLAIGSTQGVSGDDSNLIREADLAIVGAVSNYSRLRTDRSDDYHALLITKWDAHSWVAGGGDVVEVLTSPDEAVDHFVESNCPQSKAALRGLNLADGHFIVKPYCAGRIVGRDVVAFPADSQLGPIIQAYPKRLWNWIYRQASGGFELLAEPPKPWPVRIAEGLLGWIGRIE